MLNVKEAIWIDSDGFDYINFGSEQAYVDFPVKFPTVTIQLGSTYALTKIVDDMRVELGHLPMIEPDGWTEADGYDVFDSNGWYNYYITLNGFTDTMVSNCIEAIVESEYAEDNFQSYYIDISEAEQIMIYHELDKQLKKRFNTSCDELLEEARLEMIECERARKYEAN